MLKFSRREANVFQLHYAIGVFLVGAVIGALTTKSTIARGVLLVAGFTMTFGVSWGFVTLIELALGFVAGNILFARRKPRTRLLHEHFILTPGSILETESPNSKQATKGPNANARQGATPSAVEPQVDTRRSALFASAKCEQCGHHKFFSFEELTDLRKAKPQLFDSKIDSASQSRLFAKAFRCGKCGSKDIKARIA
tara:strand:+ start:660 stop:1250 length:591 start_codon:yes stop_codon:yes gene_type:complete